MFKQKIFIYFLFSVSLMITAIMFLAWNFSTETKISGESAILSQENFRIESCSLSNGYISIKGWAYLPNIRRVTSTIYAEKKDGRYIKINKSSFHVPDINKKMNLSHYELPGFSGTKRIIGNEKFSGTFIIKLVDQQGNAYHAAYSCK